MKNRTLQAVKTYEFWSYEDYEIGGIGYFIPETEWLQPVINVTLETWATELNNPIVFFRILEYEE